jgi:class 3 adenylate cyclase
MDNKARYLLRNALHGHEGMNVIYEPTHLSTILKDYAEGQFEAEIFLFTLSATAGIPDTLLKKSSSPLKALTAILSTELHENFDIDKSSAIWTVASWIYALDLEVASPSENILSLISSKVDTSDYHHDHDHDHDRDHEDRYFLTVEQHSKKLAVLFADICGSTSLYDNLGDDLARHFTANCIKTMVGEIPSHKGTLIKTIGDEIMCTFPTPELALGAACAMQNAVKSSGENSKQPLSIRIGFHYGVVICEANDVFGDTVNVAARVAGVAKADQILTTSAVYEKLPVELKNQTRQFTNVNLKGKQEQCEIYWVVWKEHHNNLPLPSVPTPDYVNNLATKIILKYIPKNTTRRQILQFVKPILNGGLFGKSGTVERISVLVQKEKQSDTVMFHAILYVQPDLVAKRVINKLNRTQLNGHYVAITEFVERSIHNNNVSKKGKQPENKEGTERRNPDQLIRIITIDQLKDFNWTENTNNSDDPTES